MPSFFVARSLLFPGGTVSALGSADIKKPASGRFFLLLQQDQAMALMLLFRRLLARAAVFLCRMPLLTMLSMTGWASL